MVLLFTTLNTSCEPKAVAFVLDLIPLILAFPVVLLLATFPRVIVSSSKSSSGLTYSIVHLFLVAHYISKALLQYHIFNELTFSLTAFGVF